MKIKFYIVQCDSSLQTCFITLENRQINSYLLGQRTTKALDDDSRIFFVNSYCIHIFLNELECCPTYHRAVARNIKSSTSSFVLQIVPSEKEFIDKTW